MMVADGGPRPAPGTLTQLLFDAVERYDKPDALQVKIGGRYEPISHRRMLERIRNLARGLQLLGVRPGDRVAIISENRPEWTIADFACLTSGVTDVSVYPTLPPQQIEYILRDSGAVAVFVSTAVQAQKIADVRHELPAITHVIGFDTMPRELADVTIDELERQGAEGAPPDAAARHREEALRVRPDDLATLIYTSGTTGEPKGVMLTHDNIYSNVKALVDVIVFDGHDVALSFLPLSHVLERTGLYLMIAGGASVAYAESIETVPANMVEVAPTLMISVPRLYEKMYARVLENATQGGAVKHAIFQWASHVADRWADIRLAGGTPAGVVAMQYALAQKLVFSKIKARTGGRMRYFVSGGAPLAPDIAKFFFAAGLTILEGYGLTETSPVITVNRPDALRIGTVGKPIEGVSVAIADDGEILARGPNIMKGYFNRPDATAETIDADGWLHTGDIGELRDGFLAITDRKKEIVVTAGGKNIAPQPIENRIKNNKFVSQAVLIADRRRFPLVLIVPNFEQLERWAAYKNLTWKDHTDLIALPEVQAKMEREVLTPLGDLAHYETPRKVVLLPLDFSLENGEVTPTLKVKRRVVDAHYKHLIDDAYAQAAALMTTQTH
ncbi:MAG TPA: long-chain fatty acid--CoA ligase [Candidatus Elarobacter sp.]|nr:long-chain fatty acid--CoA ligase [Candidatus Elarobacter sp.]